jgi:hypothetical protein
MSYKLCIVINVQGGASFAFQPLMYKINSKYFPCNVTVRQVENLNFLILKWFRTIIKLMKRANLGHGSL